jgi:hypothetical protein
VKASDVAKDKDIVRVFIIRVIESKEEVDGWVG